MSQTLEQVVASLGSIYDPQTSLIQQKQAAIPGMVAEEEKGLQAKQTQAYGDILNGARQRGLGFSGIPLGEQAKYSATEYMPALARLRQSGRDQAMSLEESLLGINERRRTQAQSIYDTDRTFAEQQRQFNESLALQKRQDAQAAASAAQSNSWMKALQGGGASGPMPQVVQNGADFQFKGADGKPLTASAYAQAAGMNIGGLLYKMGMSGDKRAQKAYDQIQNWQSMGVNVQPKTLTRLFPGLF